MINHRPILPIDEIVMHYSEKDGVPVRYVCTTELNGIIADIFYRSTKHPKFGNRYFGIGYKHGDLVIFNADAVEQLSFPCIEHDGTYSYSRYRHDYYSSGDKFIDGGRDYTRTNAKTHLFTVLNGKFTLAP